MALSSRKTLHQQARSWQHTYALPPNTEKEPHRPDNPVQRKLRYSYSYWKHLPALHQGNHCLSTVIMCLYLSHSTEVKWMQFKEGQGKNCSVTNTERVLGIYAENKSTKD